MNDLFKKLGRKNSPDWLVPVQNSSTLEISGEPMGLDKLSGLDKVQTEAANLVCAARELA